jgi:hypothetical protein
MFLYFKFHILFAEQINLQTNREQQNKYISYSLKSSFVKLPWQNNLFIHSNGKYFGRELLRISCSRIAVGLFFNESQPIGLFPYSFVRPNN